jgi:hypothetical protein
MTVSNREGDKGQEEERVEREARPGDDFLRLWAVSVLRYGAALTPEQKALCVDRLKKQMGEMGRG